MQVAVVRRVMLFAGTSDPQLASDIAANLGVQLSPVEMPRVKGRRGDQLHARLD